MIIKNKSGREKYENGNIAFGEVKSVFWKKKKQISIAVILDSPVINFECAQNLNYPVNNGFNFF